MTGYDLIEYIGQYNLGDAEVVGEGMITAHYRGEEGDETESRQISVDAREMKGNYRGNAIVLDFGDVEVDLR